jgi:hypothetical protein
MARCYHGNAIERTIALFALAAMFSGHPGMIKLIAGHSDGLSIEDTLHLAG